MLLMLHAVSRSRPINIMKIVLKGGAGGDKTKLTTHTRPWVEFDRRSLTTFERQTARAARSVRARVVKQFSDRHKPATVKHIDSVSKNGHFAVYHFF